MLPLVVDVLKALSRNHRRRFVSTRKIRFFLALLQITLVIVVVGRTFEFDAAVIAEDRSPAQSDLQGASEDWFRPEAVPESLKGALKDDLVSDRWIYHDLDAARLQAKKAGKPILVVFRCVPCGSAPGLDGAVCTAGGAEASEFEAQIRAAGGALDSLLDQFVAVRMVKMNGVNRDVFRFDRDVPYVAMFLNAEGVVYGRYGTRVSRDRKNLRRHKLTSFQQSLRRAIKLHQEYPQNKDQLKANRAAPVKTVFAEDMATFKPFPAKYNPVVKNCIHCHTVGEAEIRQSLADGDLALRDVWPFPPPENIGLKIDIEDGLRVESIRDDSAAERAGLRHGDVLLRLSGQALTSEADIQWALHHAPDQGKLPVVVRRRKQTVETHIELKGDWRKSDGHWRESLSPLRPNLYLRPDPFKERKGAKAGHMGLGIFYPRGPAAKAGLRGGDLLVAVDGLTEMHAEADFLKYIHIDRPEAKTVELTIIRKGTKSTVTLPIR